MPELRRRLVAFAAVPLLALALVAARSQTQPPASPPEPRWLVTFALKKPLDATQPLTAQPGFAEHLANVKKLAADGVMLVGGPLLDDAGMPNGAIFVLAAKTREEAQKIAASDPFVTKGVAEIVSTKAFMPGVGKWLEPPPPPTGKPAGR